MGSRIVNDSDAYHEKQGIQTFFYVLWHLFEFFLGL